MILVDLNQVSIASLMMQIKGKNDLINEDLIRHMILNCLRSYRQKFGKDYGELVICCDDKNYWRKEIFPFYKAHRKKDRDASDLDWSLIFTILNKIREELKTHFPYKVLQVDNVEADDIIATLCKHYGAEMVMSSSHEKILIVSSDKDYKQLQKYVNVSQWSPTLKKMIVCSNPELYLLEHIIRGDAGDGVPNFLSDDDSIINDEKSQKKIMTAKLNVWLTQNPEDFCTSETLKRNYHRNKAMVDMTTIPEHIEKKIIDIFDGYDINERSKMFNYFIEKRLKNLMGSIQEF
jgi:hypothetical protein